jgi:hypothetical protein
VNSPAPGCSGLHTRMSSTSPSRTQPRTGRSGRFSPGSGDPDASSSAKPSDSSEVESSSARTRIETVPIPSQLLVPPPQPSPVVLPRSTTSTETSETRPGATSSGSSASIGCSCTPATEHAAAGSSHRRESTMKRPKAAESDARTEVRGVSGMRWQPSKRAASRRCTRKQGRGAEAFATGLSRIRPSLAISDCGEPERSSRCDLAGRTSSWWYAWSHVESGLATGSPGHRCRLGAGRRSRPGPEPSRRWKLERRAGEVTLTPPGLDKIIAGQPVAPARRDQPSEPDPKAAYRTAPERGIQPSQIELVMTNMGINAALLGSGITAPRSLRPRRRERRQEQAAPSLIERCSANRRARRRS